ncbi:response regulator transcription factor [Alicyclobacillus fodiniaquatilis]|uniref:Response regulator transcription factor n=1 Tax=Alicyclobacillus fodiniaquatilis TaxID=1661150 RepID=A0ABW4JM55_9BACL
MRLLIVEDEPQLQRELVTLFRQQHYETTAVDNVFDAVDQGLTMAYDCIILDYMLPDGTGIDVVSELRQTDCHTPVLMLTVKDEIQDKVLGLNAGADDYLSKPFAPEELVARVSALVRRVPTISNSEHLACGKATLDVRTRTLHFQGGVLELTSKEYLLMECFFRHPGQVLTRDQLIARVWGPDAEVADSALDTYIYFLRKKCSHIGWKRGIQTIRGEGYLLRPEGA